MPNSLSIDRGDGTQLEGVASDNISSEGSGTGARFIFLGVGWTGVQGTGVAVRTGHAVANAAGSKILLQTFAASGGQPSISRFLLVESSANGSVTRLDGSGEVSFSPGECIDVENSTPAVISPPETYTPAKMPETAIALANADQAMQAEFPHQPEN